MKINLPNEKMDGALKCAVSCVRGLLLHSYLLWLVVCFHGVSFVSELFMGWLKGNLENLQKKIIEKVRVDSDIFKQIKQIEEMASRGSMLLRGML